MWIKEQTVVVWPQLEALRVPVAVELNYLVRSIGAVRKIAK